MNTGALQRIQQEPWAAIPSVPLTGAGLKSAIEGWGVVTGNEEMYFVSEMLKVYVAILNEQSENVG